jgi:hypothetical protein
MLCSGRHIRPGNYPVLQETLLGWTVAGKTSAVTNNQASHQALFCRDDVNILPVREQAGVFDLKKVHVSTISSPDDITQKYSKLFRLVRVTVYCKRFAFNTRQKKVNT